MMQFSAKLLRGAVIVTVLAATAGWTGILRAAAQNTPDYAAIIAAADRSDADRQTDKRRDPLPFLAFAGLQPGMKVLDMGAGAGYSTELMARTVGPAGIAYGQNPPDNLITFLFFYHDTTYINVDRARMNRKLFAALKPGGVLVIADHSARAGADPSVGKSLHRIDEKLLRQEVAAAGFKLVAEGDFWRNPADGRDYTTQPAAGPVDNFVLKFEKPR
jgi:predicted methyltransferase